ncbi:tyrosine-type recombinase/integrase [Kangiella sp.]|uniref:tyrosine-type recombinase/integrase n=1 Tax=Kangiella sp. TaxID=1920245 RepID=UPI003A93B04D
MAIRKTKHGKYEVSLSLGYDDDGRQVRRYKNFETRKEARQFEQDLLAVKESGQEITYDSKVILSSFAQDYLKYKKDNFKFNTYKNYKTDLESKVIPVLGMYPLSKISPRILSDFIRDLSSMGYAASTVNRMMAVIRDLFEYATTGENAVLVKNPAKGLKRKQTSSDRELKFWDKDQLDKYKEILIGDQYADIYLFLLNTGMRINEALSLTVDRYSKRNGVISVNRQLERYSPKGLEPEIPNAYFFGSLKSDLPRNIILSESAIEIVERNIQGKKGHEFIFQPKINAERTLKSIIYKRGIRPEIKKLKVFSANTISHAFREMVIEHDLENIKLHGLRHTFASHFVMNGGDIYALQKILGHKNITNTQIYAHLSETYMAKCKNLVNI